MSVARNGWLFRRPPAGRLEQARAELAERDARHGYGLFRTGSSGEDRRWQGLLAELEVAAWLEEEGVAFEHDGGVNSEPDFRVAGATVALKNCHGLMLDDFYVFMPVQHRGLEADWLLFTGYNSRANELGILGACVPEWYREAADFVDQGVPNPSLRLSARRLVPPLLWLFSLLVRESVR